VPLVAAATVLMASPAHAATGSPPVTVPDQLSIHLDEQVVVDLAANDSDPDGDPVQVCRLGDLPPQLASSYLQDGMLVLVAEHVRSARSLTVTYYACDSSYLTDGTLTVRVDPAPAELTIQPLRGAPTRLRFTSTYSQRVFHCRWKRYGATEPLGRFTLRPGTSHVVRVRARYYEADCTSRDDSGVIGSGIVAPPPGAMPPPHHR
jgi:Big-like domain-containing protein